MIQITEKAVSEAQKFAHSNLPD